MAWGQQKGLAVDLAYPYPEQTVRVEGTDICYVDSGEGEGPVTVFLPPEGQDLRHFRDCYARLAEGGRVVALDLPGSGKSGKPDGMYSIPYFVEFLGQFLATLRIQRPLLVGASIGGHIAAAFGARRPTSVAGLCLIAPAGGQRGTIERWRIGWALNESRIREADSGSWSWLVRRAFHKSIPAMEELLHQTLSRSESTGWTRAFARTLRSAASHDLESEAYRIMAPTLFVWGREDRVFSPSYGERLAQAVPETGRFIEIPECGHFPALEQPTVLREIAHAFREELR